MVQVIVAMTKNMGIGYMGRLPWHNPAELRLFKEKTMGKTLIMGRKTVETLPKLKGREVICLTRGDKMVDTKKWKNQPPRFIRDLSQISSLPEWKTNVFVAGGAEVYKALFESELKNKISTIHLSILNGEHECDTFFDRNWLKGFVGVKMTDYCDFKHYVLKPTEHGEEQYLDILREVSTSGKPKVGRNGLTFSVFKRDMSFDLREGFPLLTTKKMFLRGVMEEFLFFMNGKTDTTELSDKKVRIWDANTTPEFIASRGLPYAQGVMGPMYGYQFRYFNADYLLDDSGRPLPPSGGIDQLANVIRLIKHDSNSRRILLTAYNPAQAEKGVLYPCHSLMLQFYVSDNYLDMFCFNRSQDLFLGTPFNIASSALLLSVVAKLTAKVPRFLHMTMGDTHIYKDHLSAVFEQINRIPLKFPKLIVPEISELSDLAEITVSDFVLVDYIHHSAIKAPMVA